ncbi:putative G-protein coupled receptor 34 [Polymixia lowei]
MTALSSSTSTSLYPSTSSTSSNSSYIPLSTSHLPIFTTSSFPFAAPLPPSSSSTSFFSMSSPAPSANVSSAPNQTVCLFDDEALRLPLGLTYFLIFVFGLVGNLLALWVFLFLHNRRNSVRVLLINCAVADLVLLACLPFRVFYHLNGNHWGLGAQGCKLVGNLFYMNMYISITLLGLISLDRYVRIKGRSGSRQGALRRLSGRWASVVCGLLWGLSMATLVPMFATVEGNEEDGKCFQYKQRHGAKGKAYFNAVLVLLFWFVFVMLIVSYGKIAARLMKVSRDKPDLPSSQRYGRTAKKSFFVLFLFTLCFGPYHAFRPIYILSQLSQSYSCEYLRLVDRTNELMLLLSAFNSCLDPIMYFLLSGSVRKAALHTLSIRLGNRINFLNEVTTNSSTTEYRRPSLCMIPPNSTLNPSSFTPRNSICQIPSTLQHSGLSLHLPASQQ